MACTFISGSEKPNFESLKQFEMKTPHEMKLDSKITPFWTKAAF
jgi:hypothetical protein